MTIIVAAKDKNGVVIGSDTRTTTNTADIGDIGFKWTVHKNWAIGSSGSLAFITLTRYNANALLDELEGPWDFCERLRHMLKELDWATDNSSSVEPNHQQSIVLTNGTKIWIIDCVFGIAECEFACIGSGAGQANGAIEFYKQLVQSKRLRTLPIKDIVEMVLHTASNLVASCGNDIMTALIPKSKVEKE